MPPRSGVAALLALALAAGAGCAGSSAGSDAVTIATSPVTEEPATEVPSTSAAPPTGTETGDTSSRTTTVASTIGSTVASTVGSTVPSAFEPIGSVAQGNQILMIGDSILAATTTRYGGAMCRALVPLGWQVLLEAEVGRPIAFAADVERSVDADRPQIEWDAGLIFLGTNYYGFRRDYARRLERAVEFFGDAPVVLVTVSEHSERIPEVNAEIEALAARRPNVSIIDWRSVTADRPSLLIGDRIHPTQRGRAVLIKMIAEHLGAAPGGPGRCLESTFIDDPALPEGAMPTTTTTSATPGTPATTIPGTTTTVPRRSTTTTTSVAPTTPVATTVPPITTPPTVPPTVPPTTAPVSGASSGPATSAGASPPG